MVNSRRIFTTKVLRGNRNLSAEDDIDAMKNMNNMLLYVSAVGLTDC